MHRFAICLAALLAAAPAVAGPRVIASVVPIHSIVASVMGGTGTPELFLSGQLSEHRASFTASQIASLGKLNYLFYLSARVPQVIEYEF